MFPERPGIDAGDSNEQVHRNFSKTPGLTPVHDHLELSTGVEALLRKYRIPKLPHSGMNLAGSGHWTSLEERPKKLLLVIELKEEDRYRWRDVDTEARELLRKHGLESGCYVRYYMASADNAGDRNPDAATFNASQPYYAQLHAEHSATQSSLPELIPMEEIPETARLQEWTPPRVVRSPRFRRRARNDSVTTGTGTQRLNRQPADRSFVHGRRNNTSRGRSASTSLTPSASGRATPPRIHRRAGRLGDSPWRPTEREVDQIFGHSLNQRTAVDHRNPLLQPMPSLLPARPIWETYTPRADATGVEQDWEFLQAMGILGPELGLDD